MGRKPRGPVGIDADEREAPGDACLHELPAGGGGEKPPRCSRSRGGGVGDLKRDDLRGGGDGERLREDVYGSDERARLGGGGGDGDMGERETRLRPKCWLAAALCDGSGRGTMDDEDPPPEPLGPGTIDSERDELRRALRKIMSSSSSLADPAAAAAAARSRLEPSRLVNGACEGGGRGGGGERERDGRRRPPR